MAALENISTLENSSSMLSVTLHENRFSKDGSYYATVSRNTVSFKNILSEIAEDNKGLDPFMLQFAAIHLQKKILKMLEQGKAVNVLDLGTLYIGMRCSAKGKSDVPESGNFYIKFTPTSLANEALSKLNVDKVVFVENEPEILSVSSLADNEDKGILIKGSPAVITGDRLKIAGEKAGLFFAPVGTNGKTDSDESSWTKLPEGKLFRNKPKELNFTVPRTLEAGRYSLVIRTQYLSGNGLRKDFVESRSGIITVTEE